MRLALCVMEGWKCGCKVEMWVQGFGEVQENQR